MGTDGRVSEYSGVKVFSASKAYDREHLGEAVTAWLAANPDREVTDALIRQSSDRAFHCFTIVLMWRQRENQDAAT